ncbi:MAG: LptF/LptG family permease [Phycisphaerales bacterium]
MILSRYISRQFLTNACLLMAFLLAMIVAVDFSLNFDEYVKQAKISIAQSASAGLSVDQARAASEAAVRNASSLKIGFLAAWEVIDLWWPRLFLLFGFLLGPVLVGALGFTCAHMAKHREMVAILASGQSLWRIAKPMLICTLALIMLQVVNREFIIPQLAPRLTRDVKKRDAASPRDFTLDAQGRLMFLRDIRIDDSKNEGEIRGFYAWERDEQGLFTRRISADRAVWTPSQVGSQAGEWSLEEGVATPLTPVQNAGPGTRIVSSPIIRLETDVDPTALRLRRFEGLANNLSTNQISQLINRYESQPKTSTIERRIASYERIRWGRVASMFCTFLAVVVCVPFFLKKEPSNMLTQSMYAAPVGLGAFAATIVGTSTAIPGLPPQLSVFVPVLAMIPLAIAAVSSVRS